MRKAVAGFWYSPASEGVSALVVTAAFFALGSLLGGFASAATIGTGSELISSYLEGFLTGVQSDGLLYPDLFQFLWLSLRWPLAAFILGFSSLGVLGLPILSGLRGFLFSFAVGVFAQTLGQKGLIAAFFLFGISGSISVPVFLLVSTQSFLASRCLASRGPGKSEFPYNRAYVLRCCFSVLFLCIGLILEWNFVPGLLVGWSEFLL